MDTWNTTSHATTDCLTCGDSPETAAGTAAQQVEPYRRWAKAHARAHPGHHVVLEVTRGRSYRWP